MEGEKVRGAVENGRVRERRWMERGRSRIQQREVIQL